MGFEDAGFEVVFANEIDSNFSEVYKFSREKMGRTLPKFGLDVTDIKQFIDNEALKQSLSNNINKARTEYDLVGFIGGPPCPDFSIAGKNRGQDGKHGQLSQVYVDLICRELPDFFVFENVKGLWSTAKHRAFFNELVEQLHKSGYVTTSRLINALEYGAPQDRERIILIGVKGKNTLEDFPWDRFVLHSMDEVKSINWPTRSQFALDSILDAPDNIINELTVQHWFEKNDVASHPNAMDFFQPRAGLPKMLTYDEGDDSKKCYKRLHRWRYSPTAAYGNNEVHLHPYKARRLSVAETLAIQSLPHGFVMPEKISLSAKFKTIGNGVPYVAALGVAKTLLNYLVEEVLCH